jgi:AraC-like DNA-binding protein
MPNSLSSLRSATATLFRVYNRRGIDAGKRLTFLATAEAAWWIRQGEVEVKLDGRSFSAKAGEWMFVPPGWREQWFSADLELFSVNYRWQDARGRYFLPLREPLTLDSANTPALNAAAENFTAVGAECFGDLVVLLPNTPLTPTAYLALHAAFYAWLAEIMPILLQSGKVVQTEQPADTRSVKARELMNDLPLSTDVDYAELAGRAGLSRAHLERLFRRDFFLTPHSYFEQRRLDFARMELLSRRMPIKEIASNLGFRSLSRFSEWFSTRENRSPREFRRQGPS